MKDFFKLRVYLLLISKREGGILYVFFGMHRSIFKSYFECRDQF